jgi:hypothetical protein
MIGGASVRLVRVGSARCQGRPAASVLKSYLPAKAGTPVATPGNTGAPA